MDLILAFTGIFLLLVAIVLGFVLPKYYNQNVGLAKYDPKTGQWGSRVSIIIKRKEYRKGQYAKRGYRIVCRFYI